MFFNEIVLLAGILATVALQIRLIALLPSSEEFDHE